MKVVRCIVGIAARYFLEVFRIDKAFPVQQEMSQCEKITKLPFRYTNITSTSPKVASVYM
jgi:hypothetical protein